ncbi:MAG: allantoinase [Acidobacteriia bacterium]|nr:allantoinase [Terriglobia bacterium]
MAKLCLVYGMRLLPSEDIEEVNDATIKLKHERTARVSLHILEGSKEDIEKQLRLSVEAFFDLYPEI